jgi:hypothetical protein
MFENVENLKLRWRQCEKLNFPVGFHKSNGLAICDFATQQRLSHQRGQGNLDHPGPTQGIRQFPLRQQLRETLDNPGLSNSRLAHQNQIVLPALQQDLGDFQHLRPATDQRRQSFDATILNDLRKMLPVNPSMFRRMQTVPLETARVAWGLVLFLFRYLTLPRHSRVD